MQSIQVGEEGGRCGWVGGGRECAREGRDKRESERDKLTPNPSFAHTTYIFVEVFWRASF